MQQRRKFLATLAGLAGGLALFQPDGERWVLLGYAHFGADGSVRYEKLHPAYAGWPNDEIRNWVINDTVKRGIAWKSPTVIQAKDLWRMGYFA